MARGRKVTPLSTKKRKGTVQKCRVNEKAPKLELLADAPAVPDHLSGYAAECWITVANILTKGKVITDADLHQVEAYCQSYARYRMAAIELEASGVVMMNDQGALSKNPAATVIKEAFADMRAFGSNLGLDPSSRSKLIVDLDKSEQVNPFGEFT